MADEALNCFQALLQNVPGWIADLEAILQTAAERQGEILFANQPAEPVIKAPRRPSKSSSLKSKRSNDERASGARSDKARPPLKHLTNSDALRMSQRKRKTASVASGDESGRSRFRNKAAAVVYYDGDTQKQFEKLVRSVGSSRNTIRKGKMSAKVDALSRTGSICSEASSSSGDEGDFSRITSGLRYKSSKPRMPAFGRNDGTEAFDKVDGQLEKGQSLCERAAHQILRDGDCTLEVTNAKQHFAEALKLAEAELPALQKRAVKAKERRRRSEERRLAEEEAEKLRTAEPTISQVKDLAADIKLPSEGNLEVDQLEVDDSSDDDDEDAEFNISTLPPIGMGKFSRMRTSRLVAH